MRRSIDSSASSVPLAPMLLKMTTHAYSEVSRGIREFGAAVKGSHRRKLRLGIYLQVALKHLHRTYLTLLEETKKVSALDSKQLSAGIQVLRRRGLVTRVHHGAGDFAVIRRAYRLLSTQTEAIPERLTNPEIHLFGLLVPLAAYTDDLARDLENLILGSAPPRMVEARLRHARKEMEPIQEHLRLAVEELKAFIDASKVVSKEVVRGGSNC